MQQNVTTDITVCIPSLPERATKLANVLLDIANQNVRPAATLIRISSPKPGQSGNEHCVEQRNALLGGVKTTWMQRMDDDDTMLANHIEAIAPYLSGPYDVIGTLDVGRMPYRPDPKNFGKVNQFSSNSAVRTEFLRQVGGQHIQGFNPKTHLYNGGPINMEDWALWADLADHGARFIVVPVETLIYRPSPDGLSSRCIRILNRE